MDASNMLMYFALTVVVTTGMLVMLPAGSVTPAASVNAEYTNFTSIMQSNDHSGDWIPFIGTIGDVFGQIGRFFGGLANMLNPDAYFVAWGFPDGLRFLLDAIIALVVAFGIVFFFKGFI